MRLLLDTIAFLWWNQASPRLSSVWIEAIADPINDVALSAASVWEITIKKQIGKLDFSGSPVRTAQEYDFRLLPITPQDAERAGSLDWPHRDPFDRMLVAQALEGGLTMVTADAALKRAPGINSL